MNGEGTNGFEGFSDRFLKLSAVAEFLAVSERTVRRLIDTGELKVSKIGCSARVPFSAVQEFYRKITGGRELRSDT